MTISYLIDRTAVPNAALRILLRLAKTMLRDLPADPSPIVVHAAAQLTELIKEIRAALIVRFRESNPQLLATELDFDRSVDSCWVWLRKLLEGWRDLLSHPGLDALPQPVQEQINLPMLRKRAAIAAKLHDRLFGAEGTKWVQSSWVVQAETMATILALIEADGLSQELAEVVGPELPALLFAVQPHYDDIVSDRMRRAEAPSDDFRELRAQLRWQIDHYRIAVETMRDRKQPETFAVVENALRSLTELSKRLSRGATAAELDEFLEEEFVEFDLEQDEDELDTQEPALLESE